MNFRAYARQAATDQQGEPFIEHGPAEDVFEPPACAYCGGQEFEPQTENGRVTRAECSACGGTMVSHGGAWMPDLIGQPDNHPSDLADPASGGVGGVGNTHPKVPVPRREEDLSSRTAEVDWCRHRHAGHCWLPRHDPQQGVALYVPQDRGVCPWTTASMQQINCPVSEPGPMAGMTRAGRLWALGFGEDVGPLLPVKHAGFKGHVEAYEGHDEQMREMDREFQDPHGHHDFDEDLHDETRPEPHPHEQAHFDEHDEYPDSYHERHDEAYGKALQKRQEDEAPIGHHTPLINFIHSHGQDHEFWGKHAALTDVDHSQHSVYATQPYVVKRHLDRYMANRHDDVAHVHEFGHNESNAHYPGTHHPMMVKHEGNLYAIEGHHRTASDILSKRPTKAFLYDADKHGFPESHPDDMGYEVDHPGLKKYAGRPVAECDYQHSDPRKARDHARRNHDDGICAATEHKRHKERKRRKTAAADWSQPEWRFHVLATWADVRAKAKGIRAEGGVAIISSLADGITGHVNGDTGVYETQINYVPGTFKIGYWQCGCAWASYAWGRSPAFRRFEGRMCSHALALQYEAQARGMFGRQVREDTERPGWMRDKIRVRHDRVTRDHDVRAASLRAVDPDGVYPEGHGLDLERSPIHAFAVEAYAAQGDPADVLRVYLAAGIEHGDARRLLEATLHGRAVVEVEVSGLGALAAKEEPPAEPTHAGVVLKAADTGRVLMIQRSHQDETDPAAGTWEFPGGGREEGDHNSLMSGVREFEEEVGHEFPTGGHVQHVWQSPNGVYQGHVVVIPHEHAIDFSKGRSTVNPDDPDQDDHEQSAWWDPDHARKNPALRPECKTSPWDKIKAASLISRTAGDSNFLPGHPMVNLNDPEHAKEVRRQSEEDRAAGIDPEDLSSSPTITRGLVAGGHHIDGWDRSTVHSIMNGTAKAHELLHHIDAKNVGDFWHGHHRSLEDAKVYGWTDHQDHPGHDMDRDGSPIGSVGMVLEAHRPRGWDPNKNPDDGLMGNSYLAHPTELKLHKIHYTDHEGNWHHADATGHSVHATGWADDDNRHQMPDYERTPGHGKTSAEKKRTPTRPYAGWWGPGGWWLWDQNHPEHDTNDSDAGQDVGGAMDGGSEARLAEFRRRVADYASHDQLGELQPDYRPKPPPRAPEPGTQENPGSTGFATSQDPPEWENASQRSETMSLSPAFAAAVADHHTYYHITDNPDFKLDPKHRPDRNTTDVASITGGGMKPGIFLTRHPESWVNGHGYVRPYVAEIHAHPSLHEQHEGVHEGGYRGETYVEGHHFDKLHVNRVIPLDAHAREEYGGPGWIEEHHGKAFDTGEAISHKDYAKYRGYHYDGPDAREMSSAERQHHHQRWVDYMVGDQGHDREDFPAHHTGDLHPPEPALPHTTGEDEVEDPGERFRSQMSSEIGNTESLQPNDGRTASTGGVSEIVARFQATAAAQALQTNGGPGAMDIAEAARQHLAGQGGIQRTAMAEFSATERHELITEGLGQRARNFGDLKIEGTHYTAIEAALAHEQNLDPTDLFD